MDRRRITTGQALLAIGLVLLGLVLGWVTAGDGGDSTDGSGGANVGPRDTVKGVPVGYERSPDGAVAAVFNYGAALAQPSLYVDVSRLEEAVSVAGTREYVERYRPGLAQAGRSPLGEGVRRGDATVQKSAPLGYRVLRYSQDEAVVRTWAVGVLGNAGGLDPQALWGLEATTMRWDNGDWKIAGVKSEGTLTPRSLNSPTSPSKFLELTGGLRGVGYAP